MRSCESDDAIEMGDRDVTEGRRDVLTRAVRFLHVPQCCVCMTYHEKLCILLLPDTWCAFAVLSLAFHDRCDLIYR